MLLPRAIITTPPVTCRLVPADKCASELASPGDILRWVAGAFRGAAQPHFFEGLQRNRIAPAERPDYKADLCCDLRQAARLRSLSRTVPGTMVMMPPQNRELSQRRPRLRLLAAPTRRDGKDWRSAHPHR